MLVIDENVKKGNVIVINMIDLDKKQIKDLIVMVENYVEDIDGDISCCTFSLDDDDHILIRRNGDFLEPDPETKNNRF